MTQKKGRALPAIFKVVLALTFLTLGILAMAHWWQDVKIFIKGCAGLLAILLGIITLIIAKE